MIIRANERAFEKLGYELKKQGIKVINKCYHPASTEAIFKLSKPYDYTNLKEYIEELDSCEFEEKDIIWLTRETKAIEAKQIAAANPGCRIMIE